jgi:hypothetical protein
MTLSKGGSGGVVEVRLDWMRPDVRQLVVLIISLLAHNSQLAYGNNAG